MVARRAGEGPGSRKPGAGRPRKSAQVSPRPVSEEILATAAAIFAERGVASTTMAEIATTVGLRVSSLYYYFASKTAILEELVVQVNQGPLNNIARINADGGSGALRLYRMVRNDVITLCGLPFDINEVHRLAGQDHAAFGRYWTERQQLNDEVEQLVIHGVADGSLFTDDPRFAALTILANDEATQNWFRPIGNRRLRTVGSAAETSDTERYVPEEIGTRLADLTLRGLLREPARLADLRQEADRLDR
ncbi:MAG: TetR family transcriptional regulator [Acidimicrobiales bacterium]